MKGLQGSIAPFQDFGMGGLKRVVQRMDSKSRISSTKFVGGVFQERSSESDDVFHYPGDVAAGDVAYIAAMYNSSFSPAGWTMLPNLVLDLQVGQWLRHGFKVLRSADLASPVSIPFSGGNSGLGMLTAVWRGPQAISFRGHVENGADGVGSLTHHGFVPSRSSSGAFSIAIDRDVGAPWRVEKPFSVRGIGGRQGSGIYNIGLATWDARRPYSGERATWSNFLTNHSQAVGMLELMS